MIKGLNTKWATNEALLQSYRAIFITTQSIFIAIGVFSVDSLILNITIFCISVITIWKIWFPVVRSRHLAVDFFKYSLELDDDRLEELLKECKNEKVYISNEDIRRKADVILGCDKHWRKTRVKIDIVIPVLFTIIWILLVYITISRS